LPIEPPPGAIKPFFSLLLGVALNSFWNFPFLLSILIAYQDFVAILGMLHFE